MQVWGPIFSSVCDRVFQKFAYLPNLAWWIGGGFLKYRFPVESKLKELRLQAKRFRFPARFLLPASHLQFSRHFRLLPVAIASSHKSRDFLSIRGHDRRSKQCSFWKFISFHTTFLSQSFFDFWIHWLEWQLLRGCHTKPLTWRQGKSKWSIALIEEVF